MTTYRIDGHDVWLQGPKDGKQPGWQRFTVYVDDVHAGWLDRHETARNLEWLTATPRWESLGERRYPNRESAVAAILRHHLEQRGSAS